MNYERLLRRLRSSPKLWDDAKTEQAQRLISKVKSRCLPLWKNRRIEPIGPYSGLTRAELNQSRTCETDWF